MKFLIILTILLPLPSFADFATTAVVGIVAAGAAESAQSSADAKERNCIVADIGHGLDPSEVLQLNFDRSVNDPQIYITIQACSPQKCIAVDGVDKIWLKKKQAENSQLVTIPYDKLGCAFADLNEFPSGLRIEKYQHLGVFKSDKRIGSIDLPLNSLRADAPPAFSVTFPQGGFGLVGGHWLAKDAKRSIYEPTVEPFPAQPTIDSTAGIN